MEKLDLGNALAEGMAGRNPALDVSISSSQLLDSHPFNQVECSCSACNKVELEAAREESRGGDEE